MGPRDDLISPSVELDQAPFEPLDIPPTGFDAAQRDQARRPPQQLANRRLFAALSRVEDHQRQLAPEQLDHPALGRGIGHVDQKQRKPALQHQRPAQSLPLAAIVGDREPALELVSHGSRRAAPSSGGR
ncbi:MAG: hypothetical protein R6X02_11635, partial [Enhygromyxa sp.]